MHQRLLFAFDHLGNVRGLRLESLQPDHVLLFLGHIQIAARHPREHIGDGEGCLDLAGLDEHVQQLERVALEILVHAHLHFADLQLVRLDLGLHGLHGRVGLVHFLGRPRAFPVGLSPGLHSLSPVRRQFVDSGIRSLCHPLQVHILGPEFVTLGHQSFHLPAEADIARDRRVVRHG